MPELLGRTYIPKSYRINATRRPVIDLLRAAVDASGGRVVACSFPDEMVAPVFLGAEDDDGHRFGLVIYPFTTTRRMTRNRPEAEHRFQFRFGDPVRHRREDNPIARDPAGVDVTLVLAVDPERSLIVGLEPLVYADLPIGVSGYYRDEHADGVMSMGWSAWSKPKARSHARDEPGLESMVGVQIHRFFDLVRFEALATSLGLDTALRVELARGFRSGAVDKHALGKMFDIDAATILDIVEANFRLGVAVRGSVAEHHLQRALAKVPAIVEVLAIDQDGQPDFRITLRAGRRLTVECKNALRETYTDGDPKVETQKTRDSGAGRKYPVDAFDIVAACMYSVTGRWTFRYKRARDLTRWAEDRTRIGAIQRIDETWSESIEAVLEPPGRASDL